MPLAPGTRLGSYEVISPLGAGGMGEVFRARDSRLSREVALKILPADVAADPERLARFEREAQILAALNHPHIASIYGVAEGASQTALVLELVEGETLADVIARGPVPLDDALGIGRQILDALAAAHDRGIVHRDLKPANIKITPDGRVKVLDFGLAKLADGPPEGSPHDSGRPSLSMSPTITSPAMHTGVGMLLGTAAYMAPEQARGKAVDRRADVWAFGCVLFEMLTGTRPFDGSDTTELLASVIKGEPDWSRLPSATPPRVRNVLQRCLEKDPSRRIRDCGDVRLALDGAFETPVTVASPVPSRRARWANATVWGIVAALVAAAAVLALWQGPPTPRSQLFRFQLAPPPGDGNAFVISPDGRRGVFFTQEGAAANLWLYSFETGESSRLEKVPAINGGLFWSPDSRFIVYPTLTDVVRVDVEGGPPETIASLGGVTAGAWSPSGDIILGQSNQRPIVRIAPSGNVAPAPVTQPDPKTRETHEVVAFLPDGRRFLYFRTFGEAGREQDAGIFIGSLDVAPEAQSKTRLVAPIAPVTFAPSVENGRGYLLFYRGATLMAQAFELEAGRPSGDPTVVAEGLGDGQFRHVSASRTGTITFGSGGLRLGGTPTWVDRSGKLLGPVSAAIPDYALYPQLSPDNTRLAVVVDRDVWIYPLDGRPAVKVTFDGNVFTPLWTRDGTRIIYEAGNALRSMPADGSGGTPRVEIVDGHYHPHGLSLDGRRLLAAMSSNTENTWDLVDLPLGSAGEPRAIAATKAAEGIRGASISPNGRWAAYATDVTGSVEIWVRPYEGTGAAVRVSAAGGGLPVWSADGRELFYTSGNKLMVATVDTAGTMFNAQAPRLLFESDRFDWSGQAPAYDVARDGRFVMLHRPSSVPAPVTVILNWGK